MGLCIYIFLKDAVAKKLHFKTSPSQPQLFLPFKTVAAQLSVVLGVMKIQVAMGLCIASQHTSVVC